MHISLRNILVVGILAGATSSAYADVVTDWNIKAGDIVIAAKLPPGMPYRAIAAVQSAVYEAVNAITKRYPSDRVKLAAAPGASVEAAVAAANRTTLAKLAPEQQAALDSAFQTALAAIPDGPAKMEGIVVGESAANAICHCALTMVPMPRKAIGRTRLQVSMCPLSSPTPRNGRIGSPGC